MRKSRVWLIGLLLLTLTALYVGRYALQMRAKVAHVKQLRSITTVDQALKAGWGWTPGGWLIPPDCVYAVPNGGSMTEDSILDPDGKVIKKIEPCPVKGFPADHPFIDPFRSSQQSSP